MKTKSTGFTLAEVLITLAVIGVVSVLAIGIFMPKIQDKVLAAQEKTAKIKFTKAMEQMALNNKIGPLYQDTEEFVSELQNYLKVAKVCDNDKLSDCFGYETFIDAEGKEFELSDAKDGSVFNMPENNANDFTGDTKGIVTIDGTPIVLAWNKKCEILEPGVYEWSNNTNVSTSCVAALMDVNGTKRPDKIGKDLILLNSSQFKNAACIKFTVNGQTYKWGCPFEPTPLTYAQCMDLKTAGKISKCAGKSTNRWTTYDGDRWAGAVQTCGGTNNMPSMADIAALATYLYDRESNPIGATEYPGSGATNMNTSKLSALNTDLATEYTNSRSITYSGTTGTKSANSFGLWSGQESEYSSGSAYNRLFSSTRTTCYDYLYDRRYNANVLGVCKL